MYVSRTGSAVGPRCIGMNSGDIHRLKFHRKRMYLSDVCAVRKLPRVRGSAGGPSIKSLWYPKEPRVSVCNFGQWPSIAGSKSKTRADDEKLHIASSSRFGQCLIIISQKRDGSSSSGGKSSKRGIAAGGQRNISRRAPEKLHLRPLNHA